VSSTDLIHVRSDNRVTRRERRRQSDYRAQVLRLPAGTWRGQTLGNYLPAGDRRSNFLSDEAAEYAAARVDVVRREGGQLEPTRLFQNMLSSMPLCFNVFGHLRAHPAGALQALGALLRLDLAELLHVTVGERVIDGIECEWAPERRHHLNDGSAFDAVLAARTATGRRLLVAVETKYVDSFSRDPEDAEKDAKYRQFCEKFGMGGAAFDALRGPATRQLLRNVLLTESIRRSGAEGQPLFDDALTVVLARDDDAAARRAVDAVRNQRNDLVTDVRFVSHGELADAAAGVEELAGWAADFRRRYVGVAEVVSASLG
jgi:hypothetical protein